MEMNAEQKIDFLRLLKNFAEKGIFDLSVIELEKKIEEATAGHNLREVK